jgi:hypothetical protein
VETKEGCRPPTRPEMKESHFWSSLLPEEERLSTTYDSATKDTTHHSGWFQFFFLFFLGWVSFFFCVCVNSLKEINWKQ